MIRRRWSKEHEAYLLENYRTQSDTDLSIYFTAIGYKRSAKVIRKKRIRMCLKRDKDSLNFLIQKNIERGSYAYLSNFSKEYKKELAEKRARTMKKTWEKEKYRQSMGLPLNTKLLVRENNRERMLTENNIYEILQSEKSVKELSDKFSCGISTIYYVKAGKLYKDLICKIKGKLKSACQSQQNFNYR